jgi:hypothetical protein
VRALLLAALLCTPALADLSHLPPSDEPSPLEITAKHLGRHKFRVRLSNHSNRALKILVMFSDGTSPFFFRFDIDPSQTLTIRAPHGQAVRRIAPGHSLEFTTEREPIVGDEYEPRVAYDSMMYVGEESQYLTTDQCSDCVLTAVESSVLSSWPKH